MIISISGASSTGKTTLLNTLSNYIKEDKYFEYIKVDYVTEYFRDYMHEYSIDTQTAFDDPIESLKIQYSLIQYLENTYNKLKNIKHSLIICDRCPLDSLIYTSLHYFRLSDIDKARQIKSYMDNIKICKELTNKYIDRIYFTSPTKQTLKIEDDGERPKIYEDSREIEITLFDEIFKKKGIKLPPKTLDRCSFILRDIKSIIEASNYF